MPKIWKIRPVEDARVAAAAAQTGLPGPLARALALRLPQETDDVETYLNPRLADLSDPFLLPDMQVATERIWRAIDRGEAVTVFGDYDVDGITAAAILLRVLNALGAGPAAFIPDRLDEGYGLSLDAMERCLLEHRPQLIITVDCGTNAVASASYAKRQGVDLIITDHHQPQETTAEACAVINPRLQAAAGDAVHLSGAGIAFKLAHALIKQGRRDDRPAAQALELRPFLDLAALGTVADIVPLRGENRIIVRHGLKQCSTTCWSGLRELMAVAGIRGTLSTHHLGFQLGPRINAAGRIGEPLHALRLLMTDRPDEARDIAGLLDRTNRERRRVEQQMADEAFAEIDGYFDPQIHYGLVVARTGWHPGVVGIVSSRVARHYNRPAVMIGMEQDGSARGSGRGIDEFDLLEGLRGCEDLLDQYGGHRMAAGLSLQAGRVDAFRTAFNHAAKRQLESLCLRPTLQIDARVSPSDLTESFFSGLQQLQPFGQDNPEPVWMIEGGMTTGTPRTVGQGHLRFTVRAGRGTLDAIAFNRTARQLPAGRIDLAFTLNENRWNGSTALQLQIRDFRPTDRAVGA